MRWVPGALVCAYVLLASAGGAAQDADRASARDLFEDATRAAEAGRLDVARDRFQQSFAMERRIETGLNLAVVLARLGELLAAETLLEGLIEEFATAPDELRRQAAELLVLTRSEIATVELEVVGDADTVEVRVDGVRTANGVPGRPLTLRVDPGRRVVVATTPDGRSVEDVVQAERGASRRMSMRLPPPIVPPEPSGSIWESPWLWTAVGVVVAGGVVAAILIANDQGLTQDPVWGSGVVLTSGP